MRHGRAFSLDPVNLPPKCHEPRACFVTGVTVGTGMPPARMDALGIDRDGLRQAAVAAFGRTPGFRAGPEEPGAKDRRCRATVALLGQCLPTFKPEGDAERR